MRVAPAERSCPSVGVADEDSAVNDGGDLLLDVCNVGHAGSTSRPVMLVR